MEKILQSKRWTEQRARAWQESRGWLCGFNFLPSSAVNSTEMWQSSTWDETTIARELRWAQSIGFNCCRVFLQFLVWDDEGDEYVRRFERFLQIANEYGLQVMPILFDDCAFAGKEPHLGAQDEPVPGIHNSVWTPSPGFACADDKKIWPRLREYVQAFVTHFRNDARVLLWDLYNEPGNSERGDRSLPLLQASFEWAREVDPSQPISVGTWHKDVRECYRFSLENSDIITFHHYGSTERTKAVIDELKVLGRPLICTEWMARTLDSRFDSHLPMFHDENVGCIFWGLVSGRTQTVWPWGSEKGAPPPELWFHDLLNPDGSPYQPAEVEILRRTIAKAKSRAL
jgi:hypothetical protein